jgi:hypothetical protein
MNTPILPVERVLGEQGLTVGADGTRLDMRLPWYRSLPLSTTEVASLTIDGVAIDLADALIEVDGGRFPLAQARDEVDRFWFVLDSAFLVLPTLHLEPGSSHRVDLTLNLYPPYIPGMKRANPQSETLVVGAHA